MKTIKEMIEVMQHRDNGGDIQIRVLENNDDGAWLDVYRQDRHAVWNWQRYDYRIKNPEPKEIWVNEYGLEEPVRFFAHETKRDAIAKSDERALKIAVKYREVIDE